MTHKPKQTEADAAKTGMMPGHVTMVTTDPGAHDVFHEHVHSFSSYCNLTQELQLIERGWGRWLISQGYEAPSDPRYHRSNMMVDALPQQATLMGRRPPGWLGAALGSRCPRSSHWEASLGASGAWGCSNPYPVPKPHPSPKPSPRAGVWGYSQLRVNRNRGAPHFNLQATTWASSQPRPPLHLALLHLALLSTSPSI